MDYKTFAIYGFFFVGVGAFVAAIVFLKLRRSSLRGSVSPVGEKMARPAAYSLRLRVVDLNEDFPMYAFQGFCIPVVLGFGTLSLANKIGLTSNTAAIAALLGSFVVLLASWCIGFRFASDKYSELIDCQLGMRGEELVAQQLNQLYRKSYRIFHDFPIEGRNKKANIDHIVIGPTGVFVIETKMRRKHKKLKTGREFQKVEYTGDELIYPNFRDRHGLGQTEANAKYLKEFLFKQTGKRLEVAGILTLPGWYITSTGRGSVLVRNHKSLVKTILSWRQTIDKDAFREAVVAVREKCCDVEI